MEVPNFNYLQYLDDINMTAMATELASGATDFSAKMFSPGVVRPDVATITASSKIVNLTLPSPFGVVFNSGLFSTAHGTTAGSDTQSYSVNFTSLFPGSSSIIGYVLASYAQVPQNPTVITGPPQGQTGFNPAFTPYVGYTVMRDTLSITASTGAANNTTTFELARCTLNAGSGAVSGLTTDAQLLASIITNHAPAYISSTSQLTFSNTGPYMGVINVSGISVTFPPAVTTPGGVIQLTNDSNGAATLVPHGSEVFVGITSGSFPTSFIMNDFASTSWWSDGGNWHLIGFNTAAIPSEWQAGTVTSLSGNLSIIGTVLNSVVSNQSAITSGYIQFPPGSDGNRIMFQWFHYEVSGSFAGTVNIPIPYTNACLWSSMSLDAAFSAGASGPLYGSQPFNNSQISITNSDTNQHGFFFLTIGY